MICLAHGHEFPLKMTANLLQQFYQQSYKYVYISEELYYIEILFY